MAGNYGRHHQYGLELEALVWLDALFHSAVLAMLNYHQLTTCVI